MTYCLGCQTPVGLAKERNSWKRGKLVGRLETGWEPEQSR